MSCHLQDPLVYNQCSILMSSSMGLEPVTSTNKAARDVYTAQSVSKPWH